MNNPFLYYKKFLFATSYFFLIASTILIVSESLIFSEIVYLLRVTLAGLIVVVWVIESAGVGKVNKVVFVFLLAFFPYAFTEAFIAYLDILTLLIVGYALKRSDGYQKYVIGVAYWSLFLVGSIAVLSLLGVTGTHIMEWEGRVKNSMGFYNPNTFAYYLLSSAFVFYVFRKKLGFLLSGIFIVGSHSAVGNRTFFLAYFLLLFLWMAESLINKKIIVYCLALGSLLIVFVGFTFSIYPLELSSFLSDVFRLNINELFSGRFQLTYEMNRRSMFEIFFGTLKNNSDSLYVYLINGFGVIGCVFVFGFVFSRFLSLSTKEKMIGFGALLTFLTIGLVEAPLDGAALIALVLFLFFFPAEQKMRLRI